MNRYKRPKTKTEDNTAKRLHLVLAVIFLLLLAIIVRLVNVQLLKYDLYAAMASDQHRLVNRLEPERGRIFIQDDLSADNSDLYPLATNKDFALVYAVPTEVEDPAAAAETLFEILDRLRVEAEVEELLQDDDYFAGLIRASADLNIDEQKEMSFSILMDGDGAELNAATLEKIREFYELKKELEVKTRRDEIIERYEEKLSKAGDPYEPIARKVPEETVAELAAMKLPGIDYVMETHRYYPEDAAGGHILGFVGFSGEDKIGQYGLEGFFNEELSGRPGSIVAEKGAGNKGLVIVNDQQYQAPVNGSDLILTLNRSIQFMACQKLEAAVEKHQAEGGSVVVLDPATGSVIAMCSVPDYDPNNYNEVEEVTTYNNPVIFDAYEPGSIFKAITMAAGLDTEVISPNTLFHDKGFVMVEGWPQPIMNSDYETHGAHGTVSMTTVLEESLNTGSIFVQQQAGAERFAEYVKRFGFGEKTGIELETEGLTTVVNLERERIRPVEAATASFGQGITATPLQMVAAYGAIANGGILMQPYVVKEIIAPGGSRYTTQPKQIRRVISQKAAYLLAGMLVRVVDGGHAKLAGVSGYYIAGKTGTAQVADREKGGYLEDKTIHTFVGFAPVDEPRFVMLVRLDAPKDVQYSASSAAPLFGQIADFILNYYKVPKER